MEWNQPLPPVPRYMPPSLFGYATKVRRHNALDAVVRDIGGVGDSWIVVWLDGLSGDDVAH